MKTNTQRGSAIIMLFIALALFGALAIAFMQGSRSNLSLLSDEQAKTYARKIIDYGMDVQTSIKRLQARGCTERTINLENGTGNFINAAAPSDKTCDVFSTAGGGLSGKTADEKWLTTTAGVNPWFNGQIAVTNVGTSAPELIMWIKNLKSEVCTAINQAIMGAAPFNEVHGTNNTAFTGTYSLVADDVGDDAGTIYAGKTSGCLGGNSYYIVLLIR